MRWSRGRERRAERTGLLVLELDAACECLFQWIHMAGRRLPWWLRPRCGAAADARNVTSHLLYIHCRRYCCPRPPKRPRNPGSRRKPNRTVLLRACQAETWPSTTPTSSADGANKTPLSSLCAGTRSAGECASSAARQCTRPANEHKETAS